MLDCAVAEKRIQVLLIEDGEGDARLIQELLSEAPGRPFTLRWESRLSSGLARAREGVDAVLLDLSLPDSLGLATLAAFQAAAPHVPVVVMTGLDDNEVAAAAIQRGAQDYVVKGRLDAEALARAILYAIERKNGERRRQEFLHDVNHELRSPLAAIHGALAMLQEDAAGLRAQQSQLLAIAVTGVDQLMALTEDLAEVVRSETGKLAVAVQNLSLPAALSETAALLSKSGKARSLRFTVEAAPGLPEASADPLRLRQILGNLIGNAVKFTPAGGEIAIRCGVWKDDAAFAVVSVRDTGPGIAAADMPRLFERLYQAPSDAADRARGLGLGLHICRELVTRQGGKIWAESQPGKGAEFSFTLPLRRA